MSGRPRRRSDRDRVTRVHADRVNVLDRTHDDDVVRLVTHELELVFLPTKDRLLQEHLGRDGGGQALAGDALQILGRVREAGAQAAHREGGANDERVSELGGGRVALFHRVSDERAGDLGTRTLDDLLELLAVLARADRLNRGTDQLDVEALEHTHLGQGDSRVQSRLAAQRRQQRVGAFLFDNRGHDLGGDRLDVRGVGDTRVRHDGRGVGVDEDNAQALLLQDAACLRARVVELARLADDDGAGPDDENRGQIIPAGHQWVSFAAVISDMNRSKSSSPSCGPAAASGWY